MDYKKQLIKDKSGLIRLWSALLCTQKVKTFNSLAQVKTCSCLFWGFLQCHYKLVPSLGIKFIDLKSRGLSLSENCSGLEEGEFSPRLSQLSLEVELYYISFAFYYIICNNAHGYCWPGQNDLRLISLNNVVFYYIHFGITGDPYNLIGSQQWNLWRNCTIFCFIGKLINIDWLTSFMGIFYFCFCFLSCEVMERQILKRFDFVPRVLIYVRYLKGGGLF